MEHGRDPYSIHELDRSDKGVRQLRDLDLSKAATLKKDWSVRPGMVMGSGMSIATHVFEELLQLVLRDTSR